MFRKTKEDLPDKFQHRFVQKIDKRLSMKEESFHWIDGNGRRGEDYEEFNAEVRNYV